MKVYIYPATAKAAPLIHAAVRLITLPAESPTQRATIENSDFYIDPALGFTRDAIVPHFSFGNGVTNGVEILLKDGRRMACCWIVLPSPLDTAIVTLKALT